MATQQEQLQLTRCPYCAVAQPRLSVAWETNTRDHSSFNERHWVAYCCSSCGGIVLTASAGTSRNFIREMYPKQQAISEAIPERARTYMAQAMESMHAPAGAIMLTSSAVDAMLKAKGYKEGSLNSRIDQAKNDKLITDEMAAWAHEVRLDANDQRHADESMPLPTQDDAMRSMEFALALAEFVFILPERVTRGRKTPITTTVRV